jgi:[protein-PII] uridylyltransferase
MSTFDDLPITDEREVLSFLDRVPLALDRERFTRFALGFPHRYLSSTSPVEVLKHFALVDSMGQRGSISAISRLEDHLKLVIVARDRRALFSQIAGSLALFGANILSAEAIANTVGLVLDVFVVDDQEGQLRRNEDRRRLQSFLEGVIEGNVDLAAELRRTAPVPDSPVALQPSWDDADSPTASVLRVGGRDSRGLLHQLTRILAEAGCNIEIARIATPDGKVDDEFHLTLDGGRVPEDVQQRVTAALVSLGSGETLASGA